MKEKNYKPLELAIGKEMTDLHKANINVTEKNGLYLYNYNNSVLVPRDDDFILFCRGVVLGEDGTIYNYPFNRFFNYHESECDEVDIENAEIIEKLDGSLISVWHTGTEWEITTRGSFYPNDNAHNFKETFMRLFEEFDKLTPGYNYMFELISKDNRIVTRYDSERVVLIGARDTRCLQELNQKELDDIAEDILVDRPKRFKANNIEDCRKLFNGLADDEEGLVVVDKNFNRFKLKQESYLKMAKIISLKSQDVLDYMLGKVKLDEDFTDMPELQEKIKEVKRIYNEVKEYSEFIYDNIEDIETQKEFALRVRGYKIRSVLFSLRKGRTFDEIDIRWERLIEYHESVCNPDQRKLIVLRGIPGSGKSTWVKDKNLERFTLCPDTIRLMFASPTPFISQDNDVEVWKILYNILEHRMKNGDFTVLDGCFASNKSLKRLKQLCNKYGYILIERKFDISLDEALERNQRREDYKKVPEEVITRMHNNLNESLIRRDTI